MATNIIDFWKSRRDCWITPPHKQKEIDQLIYEKFWNYNWTTENLIGQIIYLDQFSRHFARYGLLPESAVEMNRNTAIDLIMKQLGLLEDFDEIELIFALMPFKHTKSYEFIFHYIHIIWLDGRPLTDFPGLQRFYIDTYKKAFTLDEVKENLITHHPRQDYNPDAICDYYPTKYTRHDWYIDEAEGDPLLNYLNITRPVIVSLSGGVDSMVLLALLKYKGVDVSAVHIVYGNRFESEDEYRFLAEYCAKLCVPFTVYRIRWLKRGEVDRQFYEDMTRDLRFATYHAAAEGEPCIVLGHIKDDVIENIWTNIAHCHHLGNLKKMEAEEVQLGVRLLRPFLNAEKSEIYRVSKKLGIPYLKNTTPSWSNRGKFRETFHAATIQQYGEAVDTKIIEFAEAIQAQNKLLNMFLYEPIYNSFKDNKINITAAVKAKLDENCWLNIFEQICHIYLMVSRPSIKCVRDFCLRLYKNPNPNQINMSFEFGKYLKIKVKSFGSDIFLEFIKI